jgi:hypothetical protein
MFKNLVYPEQSDLPNKLDYGICYCGGGFRACVLTYGSIGGILEKLDKIKYISGVSGSTWFIVSFIYYYNKIQFDKPIEPEDCTLENINHLEMNTFGDTLNSINLLKEFIEETIECDDRIINKWITVIYESFFEKYGNQDTKLDFSKYPYPLIQTTISYDDVNERLFQAEFTPYYTSVPICYEKNNIKYGGYNIESKLFCKNYYIEPSSQSGISSSFIEAGKELVTKNRYRGTNYELLNPNTSQINCANLVDGGIFENTGLIGLIRRKTKNLHMNIYPKVPITDKNFVSELRYFTSLFDGNPGSDKRGIFKLGLWDEVYDKLLYKLDNGKPLTILLKDIEILSNDYFQIEGYGFTNILLHVSSCPSLWFDKLPKQTQLYIKEKYCDFPYISVLKYKLDIPTINLMYNVIRWDIENSDEYKEFYSISE